MSELLHNALDHQEAGRFPEAEALYHQAMRETAGRDPTVLYLFATLLTQTGRAVEAAPLLADAAKIAPDAPEVWLALAQAHRLAGNLTESASAAERCTQLSPQSAAAFNELGLARIHQGKSDSALTAWRRAVELEPDYVDGLLNLGAALAEYGKFAESLAPLRRVIEMHPDHAGAHNNLGNALHALRQHDEAIPHWWKSLDVTPDDYGVIVNLIAALLWRGDYAEARPLIDRALALRPDDPYTRFMRSFLRLLNGDLPGGFADHEQRFSSPHTGLNARRFSRPVWDGVADLRGKTVLVHAEQGAGDTIQFVRYAAQLARDRGADVIVEAPEPLTTLLATAPGVSRVVARGEQLPEFDFHAPVMSLPFMFRTTLESIPAEVPYLSIEPGRMRQFEKLLGQRASGERRIGIVWAGNPKYQFDDQRSISLKSLLPLLDHVRRPAKFHSLQKGPRATELWDLRGQASMIDHTDLLEDFADTAAYIGQLDLVISVDTSVAHLVGALGRPVWLLIPEFCDWRWLTNRTDSPWYPTMRIFRQPKQNDWSSVVSALIAALR